MNCDSHDVVIGFNGAASVRTRKRRVARPGDRLMWLQWGRAVSGRGNPARGDSWPRRAACFNGAALFGARKRSLAVVARSRRGGLQWGRAVEDAETQLYSTLMRYHGLQWGRAVRARKHQKSAGTLPAASMGPRRVDAETRCAPAAIGRSRLQWGRAVRTRKPAECLHVRADTGASMGPRFGRGNGSSAMSRTIYVGISERYVEWVARAGQSASGSLTRASQRVRATPGILTIGRSQLFGSYPAARQPSLIGVNALLTCQRTAQGAGRLRFQGAQTSPTRNACPPRGQAGRRPVRGTRGGRATPQNAPGRQVVGTGTDAVSRARRVVSAVTIPLWRQSADRPASRRSGTASPPWRACHRRIPAGSPA